MHSENFESDNLHGQMVIPRRGGLVQRLCELVGMLLVRLGMWVAGVHYEVRSK